MASNQRVAPSTPDLSFNVMRLPSEYRGWIARFEPSPVPRWFTALITATSIFILVPLIAAALNATLILVITG